MSNRLEHEFPPLRWPGPAPRADHHHLLRAALVRGQHLQAAAIRRALRTVGAALARALVVLIRCGAYGIAKRAPAGDCGARGKAGA